MTSFGSLFKVLGRSRFRLVNKIILAELAVIAVTLLWSLATRGIADGELLGVTAAWSVPTIWIVFIMLSIETERVYTRDTYRLIPIGETQLYLSNLITTFVMFIYFGVIQVVLYLITATVENTYFTKILAQMTGPEYTTLEATKVVFGVFGMALAIFIMGWTTISLVHLAVSATNNFLPNVSRRAVDVVLYIVVIYLVTRVAIFMLSEFNNLGGILSGGQQTQLLINIAGVLVVALVESVINVFLLKKWVETIPN
ncbi:ABC transporter permease [Levilactobacillus fujinensis]|uniref:ABC transporter permease n=1 Tax=Levilactobacillus fujinensis TaxID=2486024 RepID=A0ABW1TJY6_9LACO|nr:ABC transporter permease [Levilactobacillus fujinensis]